MKVAGNGVAAEDDGYALGVSEGTIELTVPAELLADRRARAASLSDSSGHLTGSASLGPPQAGASGHGDGAVASPLLSLDEDPLVVRRFRPHVPMAEFEAVVRLARDSPLGPVHSAMLGDEAVVLISFGPPPIAPGVPTTSAARDAAHAAVLRTQTCCPCQLRACFWQTL